MKRAPPNSVPVSEPPLSKKIRIVGDSTGATDLEDGLGDEKTSGASGTQSGSKGIGGSGQGEQWTRVERRKQKKAKKLGDKSDVCVFHLIFLIFTVLDERLGGVGQVLCTAWRRHDLIRV